MLGRAIYSAAFAASLWATPAAAEFSKITSRDDFIRVISGKTLARPLVRLQVSPEGAIEGRGAHWDVTGKWRWQNGYFCRDLNWGGDDLGYNCQEVRVNGNRIRFTSDQGAGDSADFSLK